MEKKRVFEIAYLCQTSQKTSLHITGGIKIISWSGPRIIQHLLNLTLQQLNQAPDVQKVDNAIHWINLYPLDGAIGLPDSYLLGSDLSSG